MSIKGMRDGFLIFRTIQAFEEAPSVTEPSVSDLPSLISTRFDSGLFSENVREQGQ
jgi:hypothetical protein